MAIDEYVRVQVKVGQKWIPAHLGVVSRKRGEEIQRAYATDRPNTMVQLVSEHAPEEAA